MPTPKLITIKVSEKTRRAFRLVAAHSGKKLHEVAERLAEKERKRLKL